MKKNLESKQGIFKIIFRVCAFGVLAMANAASAATVYSTCASEQGQCAFVGSASVRYGANAAWSVKTLSGGTACSNSVFGDPAVNVVKTCQLAWETCSNEGTACAFTGSRTVRYGANSKFAVKVLSNGTACSNAVFGDPAPGVAKSCQLMATGGTIATPVPAPVPAPVPPATVPPSGTRDPLKQPFALTSIWNMPIGSGAQYVPANLKAIPGDSTQWMQMPYSDDDVIVMKPTAPLTNIMYSSVAWSGGNRCGASNSTVLAQVPMPSDFLVPSNNGNMSSAFLMPDNRTILQTQPFARCNVGGYATSLVKANNSDIYGDGIEGAHGGSGMSSVGGTLRVGEMRPGQQGPQHAIKLVIYMKEAFKCTTASACYRWPATHADGYAVGNYGAGVNNPNVNNAAMKMGALLALPASVNIANLGLETAPAKQLAWTLQNYGGYVVDDTYGAQFGIPTEVGPDGSFPAQFKADYGFSFNDNLLNNSPWRRDIQRLLTALNVVNNNGPTSIGGGGTPRQPLAAPLK